VLAVLFGTKVVLLYCAVVFLLLVSHQLQDVSILKNAKNGDLLYMEDFMLSQKYFAFMVDYLHLSRPLTT